MSNTINVNDEIINVRVEYESIPVRHLAIQCPFCKKWFHASDLTNSWISYSYEIETTEYFCPVCQKQFNHMERNQFFIPGITHPKIKFNYTETSGAQETYKDCVEKKVTWE